MNSFEVSDVKKDVRDLIIKKVKGHITSSKLSMISLPQNNPYIEQKLLKYYKNKDSQVIGFEKKLSVYRRLKEKVSKDNNIQVLPCRIEDFNCALTHPNVAFVDLCSNIHYCNERDTVTDYLKMARNFGENCPKRAIFMITYQMNRSVNNKFYEDNYGWKDFKKIGIAHAFAYSLDNVVRIEHISYQNKDVSNRAAHMITFIFYINKNTKL